MALAGRGGARTEQFFGNGLGLVGGGASEASECRADHLGPPAAPVELRFTFLHLADQHVGAVDRHVQDGIHPERWVSPPMAGLPGNQTSGSRETEGEHVDVRCRAELPLQLYHRILDHGEVAVQSKVGLHERYGAVHGAPRIAGGGGSTARMTRDFKWSPRSSRGACPSDTGTGSHLAHRA